jgi:hypothetical protein
MVDESVSRMSVSYLLHDLYKNDYKFENGVWYYLSGVDTWLPDVNNTLREKIRGEIFYIYVDCQHRYQNIYGHLCQSNDYGEDACEQNRILKSRLNGLSLLIISCITDHDHIMLESSLLFC